MRFPFRFFRSWDRRPRFRKRKQAIAGQPVGTLRKRHWWSDTVLRVDAGTLVFLIGFLVLDTVNGTALGTAFQGLLTGWFMTRFRDHYELWLNRERGRHAIYAGITETLAMMQAAPEGWIDFGDVNRDQAMQALREAQAALAADDIGRFKEMYDQYEAMRRQAEGH